MRALALGALALALLMPLGARADATFEIIEGDDGLRDPTPRKPVGGNPGTTLGEQRRKLLERAMATWGKNLESDVPISIVVSFDDDGCPDSGFPLAGTGVVRWVPLMRDGKSPVYYPVALANRLLGIDQYPAEPDMSVSINGSLDGPECLDTASYYGFEPPTSPSDQYMLPTLLHELAHGLGFSSSVDLRSGRSRLPDGVDVFSTHIRDLDLDRTWAELTGPERAQSALNVRKLVFDGASTNAATAQALRAGASALTFEPAISGFTGWIGEATSGANPAQSPARGPLVTMYGADVCTMRGLTPGAAVPSVILVEDSLRSSVNGCTIDQLISRAQAGGAVGLLLPSARPELVPAITLDLQIAPVPMPIFMVPVADVEKIASAVRSGPTTAVLGGRKDQLQGADSLGRPLLYATAPVLDGSSISHFDTLARPDLLMEAFASSSDVDNLDLTVPVLRDLGWTVQCGNGKLDGNEACDEGEANSDSVPDGCRTTCRRAGCGDGLVDTGEACDQGTSNSDTTAGACRTNCMPARCGDGVIDSGEGCDQGAANGGTAKGACRMNCLSVGCGDGVLDPGESCDRGIENSDVLPGACRTTCLAASCGDHVVDAGEECDGDESCTSRCTRDVIASWTTIEKQMAQPAVYSDGGCSVRSARSSRFAPLGVALAAASLCVRRRRKRRLPR